MFEAQLIKKLRQTESEFKKAVAIKKTRNQFSICYFLKPPETIRKPKGSLNYEIKSFGLLKGNTGQNYK